MGMMAFSRVSYICKCPTLVPARDAAESDEGWRLIVRVGEARDLERLPEEVVPRGHRERLRARLDRGELLIKGELDGTIVSATWLRCSGTFLLHHLPDHPFRLGEGVGYGYDAWTAAALQGKGLRRVVFAEELRILARLGCAWEVSYFVQHQLDGGRRSLAKIGVPLLELWKVTARPGGVVQLTARAADGRAAVPCFAYTRQEETDAR